jgi:hypothetical protein
MAEVVDYRFRLRRGLAATWTALDDVLLAGEIGLETDTGKLKIGDGATGWNALPYGPTTLGPANAGANVTIALVGGVPIISATGGGGGNLDLILNAGGSLM